MRDCALGILADYACKYLVGWPIRERMKECNPAIKLLLYCRLTRSGKGYRTQLFGHRVAVYLLSYKWGANQHQRKDSSVHRGLRRSATTDCRDSTLKGAAFGWLQQGKFQTAPGLITD